MNHQKIAQNVIEELGRRGVAVPDDDFELLVDYAKDAEGDLRGSSSYNPSSHARVVAEAAAREYVKARYMGQPVSNSAYPFETQKWMEAAAREFHSAN